ncbi:lipoprotein signal peptidase [Rothia aerolata]|uniref:Lipoprotein signal peptidase n=1 Tax=Rothia aerolata TaxID=1812262 RepID=A0A917MPM1_9MICC|nr:lipoprotein signal peptidase [Rothia aerolata]
MVSEPKAHELDRGEPDQPKPQERPRTPVLSGGAKAVLAVLVLGLAFGADQWVKRIVETHMQLGERITVIDGVMWWHYILNPGAAFSIGEEHTWVFTLVMAVAVCVSIFYLLRATSLYWVLVLSLLTGGILGNLTDRLFRAPGFGVGHVVDYISIGRFAIFNIADSCICVSMAALVLLVFLGINLDGTRENHEKKQAKHAKKETAA